MQPRAMSKSRVCSPWLETSCTTGLQHREPGHSQGKPRRAQLTITAPQDFLQPRRSRHSFLGVCRWAQVGTGQHRPP